MNDTTYTVYLLSINGQPAYVGQTCAYESRKYEHYRKLRYGKHYNTGLQEAFYKYGRRSIKFQVLESCIKETEVNDRERHWIDVYDTFNNGLNQTSGGHLHEYQSNTCNWNGIEYPSMAAAARANGVNERTMRRRIAKGYTCDEDLGVSWLDQIKETTWNGITYRSLAEAAKSIGVPRTTLQHRLAQGYTCDSDLKRRRGASVLWNGVCYKNLTTAAKATGIPYKALWYRINRGYTCDADMKHLSTQGTPRAAVITRRP